MKLRTRLALSALTAALAAPLANAHEVWLLPSSTVLSNTGYVTVDGAVSNDTFHFNYRPLRITDNLVITAPNGSAIEAENLQPGHLRTVFDVELTQPGSYRLAVVHSGVMASWKEGNENKRWRGSRADLEANVPADATDLRLRESAGRIETFVTVGRPSEITPTGAGLELIPVTHPNDLYAGEAATFAFLLDGKPAPGATVSILPGGARYRDTLDKIEQTTDADGRITVTWPAAGMYYISTSVTDSDSSMRNADRRASYSATLEVLPQ
jgi:uncharacterized GH25 family protein